MMDDLLDTIDRLRKELATAKAKIAELEQECEQEHCDILVCTECGRTSKHGWIGVVYESTPNSAEEYDTKCPECGSMSLDEDARSVVNELDTAKAELATSRREGFEAVIAQFPIMGHKDQYEEGQMDERDAITGWCRAQLKETR